MKERKRPESKESFFFPSLHMQNLPHSSVSHWLGVILAAILELGSHLSIGGSATFQLTDGTHSKHTRLRPRRARTQTHSNTHTHTWTNTEVHTQSKHIWWPMKAVEKTTWLQWTLYRRVVFHHRALQYCKHSISHTIHALVGYTATLLYVQYAWEISHSVMCKLQSMISCHKTSQGFKRTY